MFDHGYCMNPTAGPECPRTILWDDKGRVVVYANSSDIILPKK